jgi:isopentenyl-diphosphate delta-isomerase
MRVEWVVLVDEADREVGVARKDEVHHAATPLHRAFSLFLFDRAGRTLLQRRAWTKKTWPGIWSNGCCGHPGPGESTLAAASRRCREELGATPLEPWIALPDFRYRAELDGVVENEICPVLAAQIEPEALSPDPDEVAELRWLAWEEWLAELERRPEGFSPWSVEEVRGLEASPSFAAWRAAAAAGAAP